MPAPYADPAVMIFYQFWNLFFLGGTLDPGGLLAVEICYFPNPFIAERGIKIVPSAHFNKN